MRVFNKTMYWQTANWQVTSSNDDINDQSVQMKEAQSIPSNRAMNYYHDNLVDVQLQLGPFAVSSGFFQGMKDFWNSTVKLIPEIALDAIGVGVESLFAPELEIIEVGASLIE